MKIFELNLRITKIIKIKQINAIIMKIMTFIKFQCENHEDTENHRIPIKNYKK